MKTLKNWIIGIVALLVPVASALAQTPDPPVKDVAGLLKLMCVAFGWMFYGLIALSVVMIVIAGFNYTTAGDNAEKVGKANKMILYAAIGVAVALLAKGVPSIVGNFIGASGNLIAC